MKKKIYYLGGTIIINDLEDLYSLLVSIFPNIQLSIKSVVDTIRLDDDNMFLRVESSVFSKNCVFEFVYYDNQEVFMKLVFQIEKILKEAYMLYYLDYFERDDKGNVISEEISLIHEDWFNAQSIYSAPH